MGAAKLDNKCQFTKGQCVPAIITKTIVGVPMVVSQLVIGLDFLATVVTLKSHSGTLPNLNTISATPSHLLVGCSYFVGDFVSFIQPPLSMITSEAAYPFVLQRF